ncbi:MAG: hypothetical protein E6H09_10630 [Bacteroidetes bacterium]|jgi:hypothetical protein|nr:MAG: hypothetical protein E6H09_10630 [Bacteroidota bacterium]
MIQFILVAMFGAFVQEFSHWYEKRKELDNEMFTRLMKSKIYWVIVLAMILVSGIGTYLLFGQDIMGKNKAIFVIGAAFPLIFKKTVKIAANRDVELGDNLLEIYFQ